MVDEGKIGFRPAVELSYLTKTHQINTLSLEPTYFVNGSVEIFIFAR